MAKPRRPRKRSDDRRRKVRIEGLEPRLLLSADLLGAFLDTALPPGLAPDEMVAIEQRVSPFEEAAGIEQHASSRELVLVDAGVEGHEKLVEDLLARRGDRAFEVVVLDSGRDGIVQIGEVLKEHRGDLDAVHVVSHGSEHGVQLGDTWLTRESLEARADDVSAWREAFAGDADLLFYGCDLAGSAEGRSLVQGLAALTGADVAASSDPTGASALGGDWELEYTAGRVEARVAFSEQAQRRWTGLLATYNVDTFADVVDGGDGLTSLREAVLAANADSAADSIVLAAGTYTLDLAGAGEDASATGDLDVTEDLTITGAGADSTVLDAAGLGDRVLQLLGSSQVTISGLTIQNGDAAINTEHGGGVYVATTSDLTLNDVVVSGNTATRGGGIYNAGKLTLTDVEIVDNGDPTDTIFGGGLDNEYSAFLERVTISGNRAGIGAGLYHAIGALDLSLRNVTVSGNAANTFGGGLYTRQSVSIESSTFTGNTADTAGGIVKTSGSHVVILESSIVAGNVATTAVNDVAGDVASQGFNIIGDSIGATGFVVSDQLDVDPLLDPVLRDNGGATRTHALLVRSPALDAGTAAGGSLLDQRGLLRDSLPDVGAYEAAAPAVALWATTDQDVAASGAAELPTWDDGEVIQLSAPGLAFGSPSDGTWSSIVDFDAAAFSDGDVELYALHYVGTALTLGGTGTPAVDLTPGDLLLVSRQPELWNNPGVIPDVNANEHDVVLFHPDRPGDYGSGTFSILLEDPLGAPIAAFSLAEANTQVGPVAGGTAVPEGAFLAAATGSNQVVAFSVDDVGAGSTVIRDLGGSPSATTLLLDGPDFGLDQQISGLELIEADVLVGGKLLGEGNVLISVASSDSNVGGSSISVERWDIVRLDVLATGAASDADADFFLQGSDVHLDSNEEALRGFTLIPDAGDTILEANDDAALSPDGLPLLLDVLANDTGDPIAVFDFTLPAHGGLAENPDGSLTYTPDPGYVGPDAFDYVVTDGREGTAHYWKLDGDASDSVGSNDGVVNGTTTVSGHYGNALDFDESSDHVVIPDFVYGSDFSVSFRFKVDDNSGAAFQYLYSHGQIDTADSLNIYIGESGSAYPDMLLTNIKDSDDSTDGTALNVDIGALGLIGDAQWHSYTLSVTSGVGSEVFIDGVSRSSAARGDDGIDPATDLYLGAREDLDPNRFYGGALDSVQVFDRALDAAGASDLNSGGAALASVSLTLSNTAPTISGAVAGQAVDDDATLAPFSGISISDADAGDLVTLVVTLSDGDANGQFSAASLSASGFTKTGVGEYSLGSGTPAAAQAAIRQLVFGPTENQVASGGTVTTTFSIVVDDGTAASMDAATTVVATSINDAPTIGGTVASQAVDDDATLSPFSGVTLSDVDFGEAVTVTITLSDGDANGSFTAASLGASGFAKTGVGEYTLAAGTPAAAQTAVRQLVFDPTQNQVVPGSTVTTAFSIEADDGDVAPSDAATTVIATSINDAPTIGGTVDKQKVDDDSTRDPFTGVTIGDPDPAQTLTVDVQLDDVAKGVLANLGSFSDEGGGLYRFSGTAAAATTAIRGLTFDPTENRLPPGAKETTTFTITADDGVAPVVVDSGTSVETTSINDAPAIGGTLAGQTVDDDDNVAPFTTVTLSDVDSGEMLKVKLTLSDGDTNGVFTAASLAASGFARTGSGRYELDFSAPAAAQAAIRQLVFDPTRGQVGPGSTVTTTFSIELDDGEAKPTDSTTTMIATALSRDGSAIWSETGSAVPEVSSFDGGSFSIAGLSADVDGPWRIIDGAEAPTRDEKIVIGVDASGSLSGQIWRFGSWLPFGINDFATVSDSTAHGFDVAYESQSGHALLVYDNGTSGTTGLSYRIWNSTNWSAATSIVAPRAGEPKELRLAASPDSDEMVLVVSNENFEDYALVWDGSSWGNAVVLDPGSAAPSGSDVAVAYEQQSGRAVVVHGKATHTAFYRVWDGASWSAQATISAPAAVTGEVRWSALASDPTSDRLALGVLSDAGETWLAVWDGSDWEASQLATATATGTGFQNVAVAFESRSNQALAVYGEAGSHDVQYRTWSSGSGWSAQLQGPGLGDDPHALALASDPRTDGVMLSALDSGADVEFALWDGRAWDQSVELESDSGEVANQPFLFLWNQAPATLAETAFWLSTDGDVGAPSGVPGLVAWSQTEVLELGDPDLVLEPVGAETDGTLFPRVDLAAFGASGKIDALHYVTRNLEIGASGFELFEGDLLLSTSGAELLSSVNDLAVSNRDVFVFRPSAAGDYGVGSFFLLLEDPLGTDIRGVTLVEADTLVGDVTLQAGGFLLVADGGSFGKNVMLFETTDVGVGSSGVVQTLLDGNDPGVDLDQNVRAIDLVETNISVGGTLIPAGSLLLGLANSDSVGVNGVTVDEFDVVLLDVDATTLVAGPGNGSVTATLLFDGSDLGLSKKLNSLSTLATDRAPQLVLPGPALAFTEGDPASILDATASVNDPDATGFAGGSLVIELASNGTADDRLAIRDQGAGAGNVSLAGSDVSYDFGAGPVVIGSFSGGSSGADPLVVSFGAGADPTSVQAVVRNITYQNVSVNPSTAARTVHFTLTDGGGAEGAPAVKTVNVSPVNSIPTIAGAVGGQAMTDQDALAPFTGVTLADADGASFTLSIELDDAAKGTLTNLGGFVAGPAGTYTFTGTPAAATAAIRGLVFDPTENRVAPGAAETTTFTLTLDDGIAAPVVDAATTVSATSVNDAPSLGSASLASVVQNEPDPPGETVAKLFAGKLSDADAGSDLAGVAVVGNPATANQGTWQFSSDGGTTWAEIGSVGDGSTALALGSGSRLRFVPAKDFSGSPGTLRVRALDDTYGGGFSTSPGGAAGRVLVDTSSNGGSEAISAGTSTVSTGVLPSVLEIPDPPTPSEEPSEDSDEPAEAAEPEAAEPDPLLAQLALEPLVTRVETLHVSSPRADAPRILQPGRLVIPAEELLQELGAERERDAESAVRAALAGFGSVQSGIAPGTSLVDLIFLNQQTNFLSELDRLREDAQLMLGLEQKIVGTSTAIASGLSVGYVIWLTRGGLLLASLLSSMPAWRLVDPIPVLAGFGATARSDDEDDSLESLVSGEARNPARSDPTSEVAGPEDRTDPDGERSET